MACTSRKSDVDFRVLDLITGEISSLITRHMCTGPSNRDATLCLSLASVPYSSSNSTMAVLAQKSCTARLAQKATRASAVRAPVVVVRAQKQNVESVEVVRT